MHRRDVALHRVPASGAHQGAPLLVLMHGNRTVSTKNLARQIGVKSVAPCTPEVANRHSGFLVGISPDACVRLLNARPVDCALEA